MDQKNEQEEETFRNFIKNNILVFFVYNPKVYKSLNYSRIYNSYWNIIELVQIIILNVLYSSTKASFPIIFFTILTILTILSNFIPRIGNKYNYFQYMMILNVILQLIAIAPIYYSIQSFDLIDTLCGMIELYGQTDSESNQVCSQTRTLFYSWFIVIGVYFLIRVLGVYLGYVAYAFLIQKHNIEETKRRRKQRYIEMYKKKEQKKGIIENYGDRRL